MGRVIGELLADAIQQKFFDVMRQTGALAGVAHSVSEALRIVEG